RLFCRQQLTQAGNANLLDPAVNAEELLLCAAVERLLQDGNNRMTQQLRRLCQNGNWPRVVPGLSRPSWMCC
ncbi:MAG: hypothetical protein AAGC55_15490, partial [Myxococcota bacterium]